MCNSVLIKRRLLIKHKDNKSATMQSIITQKGIDKVNRVMFRKKVVPAIW